MVPRVLLNTPMRYGTPISTGLLFHEAFEEDLRMFLLMWLVINIVQELGEKLI